MSRRRRASGAPRERRAPAAERPAGPTPASRPKLGPRLATDAAVLIAVLGLVTLICELAGAANLGVSLGIGTIAYAIALMVLMLRR